MAYPKKYRKRFAQVLPSMYENGKSTVEVCVELGVSRAGYYKWIDEHPEFKEAHERGKEISEAWWASVGRAATVGKIHNFQGSAWVFTMKNRFGWRDQPQDEKEDHRPLVINITDAKAVDVDD